MKTPQNPNDKLNSYEHLRKQVISACGPLPIGVSIPNLSNAEMAQFARSPQKLEPLSDAALDMVLGTILGDASMGWTTTFPRYNAVHSTNQKDYCQSKLDLLRNYSNSNTVKEAENLGWGNKVVRFSTMSTPVFEIIRHLCYKSDPSKPSCLRKAISKERVEQLNWAQVAWWYQDDGCRQSRGMNFGTHAFPRDEVELLVAWFQHRRVDAKSKRVSKGDKDYWIIDISTKGAEVLVNEIRPFMHPSLVYKLPTFLEKTGSCLSCGGPTEKASEKGPVVQLCSSACRKEWETRRSRNRLARMSKEEKRKKYEKGMAAIKADPERYKAYKAYHAKRREEIASDPERKAAGNDYKRIWKKKRKAEGLPVRKMQTHKCRYCQNLFSNSATHKMSPRSPFISCPAPDCMARREEDYLELRRERARERWAREKSSDTP